MAVTFTPEQQKVIDTRGCNILVSAAAGSGKTAVLTERIVQMVCDEANPVDIDRLLVVTFTNAAAAEMRERIALKISEKLSEHPESEHIQRQAALLHNAQITTIDSFCLFLLRNHFNEIGLDPAFRIADEGELKLLKQDVLGEMLEEAYSKEDEDFHDCVEYFCPGGRESALEKHILSLSRYAASFPWPTEWLLDRKRDYEIDSVEALEESECGKYVAAYLKEMIGGFIEKLERVRKICEEPDGPYMFGEMVEGEIEQLEDLLSCERLRDFEIKLPAVSFGRLSSKKDESVSPDKRKLAGDIRAEVKKSIQGIYEKFLATPLDLTVKRGAACRKPVSALIDLVVEFDARMAEKKREKKIVDFADVEHFALDILVRREEGLVLPSSVAREYRQHFTEILTDEYQDSNLVQEYILQAVSGENSGTYNRFMVGDVKQSIYKFRLARPELFLEKYNTYGTEEGAALLRIDLSKNFRSRTQVVDAVNDVFSRIMDEKNGGIVYDDRAALYACAGYPKADSASELLLIQKPSEESGRTDKEQEALAIAAKIKEMKENLLVTDSNTKALRPVRYSDMVILLRTNSGWDEEFKAVLEEQGIPVYITSKTGYFSATEVQELLQLLRVLDNPRQDIPLFGVMKSVFGGFTEEEIALIRSSAKGCDLYEAIQRAALQGIQLSGIPEEETSVLKGKAADFLAMIKEYRKCTIYLPVRELLTKLVTDFDYLNYVTALPAGSKRKANVEMLFTRASEFEKTSYFGLFHFVRYMEQLEKYDVDYGEADFMDENADVVRIMSIHKSKGLEFPVTFVSGLSKKFNMQDVNQSLIVDMDFGLGADYVDPDRRLRDKTFRRMAVAQKLKADSLGEELRVLYVAMTRAREKLVLTGTVNNAEALWEQYRQTAGEHLSFADFMESTSYLDFLLPIIGNTSIRTAVVPEEALVTEALREQISLGERKQRLDGELFVSKEDTNKLLQRLKAPYGYERLSGLYNKTTVSELKLAAMAERDEAAYHSFEEKEVRPYIPSFRRQEQAVSGTVRGNAYHRVMELLELHQVVFGSEAENVQGGFRDDRAGINLEAYRKAVQTLETEKRLVKFLDRQVESLRLKEEYRQAVSIRKILNFLQSELGFRMWKAERAGKLYREQPFVLGVEAARLGEQYPKEEKVLIQGIIDVFFEEKGGLVLLDYKTDAVHSLQELWERYETQIDYYKEALENIRNLPVKERILYSFHLEQF